MKPKKNRITYYDDYWDSVTRQEVFGIFFAVVVVALCALGLFEFLEHFPRVN